MHEKLTLCVSAPLRLAFCSVCREFLFPQKEEGALAFRDAQVLWPSSKQPYRESVCLLTLLTGDSRIAPSIYNEKCCFPPTYHLALRVNLCIMFACVGVLSAVLPLPILLLPTPLISFFNVVFPITRSNSFLKVQLRTGRLPALSMLSMKRTILTDDSKAFLRSPISPCALYCTGCH